MAAVARETRRSPVAQTTEERQASAAARAPARGPQFADASVSTVLSGKPLYRMSDGRLVELPEGMTAEEAAKLEREAKAAQQKLGKGPPPKPVPDVHKPADKSDKTAKPKAKGKGGGGRGGKGGSVPRTAGVKAHLKPIGGKAAQYLLGKATPILAKGIDRLRTLSRNEQTHDNAAEKVGQAEKAVVIPPSEGQSKSNAGQVGEVGGRPAPPVDERKGKQKLQESLAENVPQTIEDVDNFKRDAKAQHMGADVMEVVQGDKNAVVSTFADVERTPAPTPPETTPEPLPPPEMAPGTPGLNLGQDAVAPLQPEHTDVSKYTNEADARLKEEGVTQEQLDMVDSGDLAAANKEKKGMEQTAKSEPAAIQKFSQDQAGKVDKELKQEEAHKRGAAVAKRKAGLAGTAQKQKTAKSHLEKKRDEVAAKINGIYKTTQDKVKRKLADLETQSMKRFDDGNAKATKAFEDNVNREIDAFKDDRYSGLFGWARKAKDWLLGMDDLPEVKAIFDRNRATFVATIDKLVAEIGADNKRVVQECKDDLARAKTEIKDYVDKLGPELKSIAKKTAGEVNGQLEQLDGFVRKQEEELQQKLADKQQAAIKAIDDKIEKMKEAMAGALAKLGKLLLWAAKKLFTWALSKFGYSLSEIEAIINKGAAVLKAIFTKPIAFVKNLMNAALLGFKNFAKNFLKHLKDALFEWLTGSLEGVTLPTTWDLQGIAGLALQMLGISYANIRRHLVAALGEPVVVGLEKGFQLVKTLITEGPMAAWEQLKEMAAEMRDAFIDAVKDFIKTKIIEQAIIWLGSLFIPGAGLIKAAIGIYDTIVFFIQKAKQIATMIANFLGSIGEIAAGNIGAAADAMEKGLARGLSLVISFLAKLLRLDAITAKIRNAIQKVRAKVDSVLERVAKWIGDKAKKLVGLVKTGVKKLVDWWTMKTTVGTGSTRLTLYTEGTEESTKVLIAQSPGKPWSDYLAAMPKSVKTTDPHKKATSLAQKLEARRKPITEQDEAKRTLLVAKASKEMQENFNDLAAQIKLLNGNTSDPASIITFESVNPAGGASGAESKLLAKKHPPGAPPGDYAPIWENLADLGAGKNKKVRKDWYVQGHLLNHNIGGPGQRFNLTPITKAANNEHKTEVESTIKKKIHDDKLILFYSIVPQPAWGTSLPKMKRLTALEKLTNPTKKELAEIESLKALRKLSKGFVCRVYELEQNAAGNWVKKKGGWDPGKKTIPNSIVDGSGEVYGYN